MSTSNNPAPQVPPEVARYLKGATLETRQFDFLIGSWEVAATKFKEDGSILFDYQASWNAQYLNDGRMVMDDFKAHLPTGQAISSYVTLRTYSETSHRWEMTGLSALQTNANAQWFGEWEAGEMLITAIGKNPEGDTIHTRIRFFNIEPNRFHWESRMSRDGGKTWTKSAALVASRIQA